MAHDNKGETLNFLYSITDPFKGATLKKVYAVRILRKLYGFPHIMKVKGTWASKGNRTGTKKKKLAQRHLNNEADVTLPPTDDGQETTSVHICNESDEPAATERDVTTDLHHLGLPGGPISSFILEYVEVVSRRHGDDVVLRVPGGVKDFLVEVQTVHADLVLLAFAAGAHLAGL